MLLDIRADDCLSKLLGIANRTEHYTLLCHVRPKYLKLMLCGTCLTRQFIKFIRQLGFDGDAIFFQQNTFRQNRLRPKWMVCN